MKFVCLNLWLGEVCTDDNADDDDDAQSMIVSGSLADKQNEKLPLSVKGLLTCSSL